MVKPAVRVLLVDDDKDEYVIVDDLLRAAPDRYNLAWSTTYEQGLKTILSLGCHVCLVDYRLGEHWLADVTASSSRPPVIFLTRSGDPAVDVTPYQRD
jgi:DNA-binding response OmpR family regulator